MRIHINVTTSCVPKYYVKLEMSNSTAATTTATPRKIIRNSIVQIQFWDDQIFTVEKKNEIKIIEMMVDIVINWFGGNFSFHCFKYLRSPRWRFFMTTTRMRGETKRARAYKKNRIHNCGTLSNSKLWFLCWASTLFFRIILFHR